MNQTRKAAYLALIATMIIWGLSPPIIKFTLNFVSPFEFLFFRFFIAGLIFLLPTLILIKKNWSSFRQNWWRYFLFGLLGTPVTLFFLFSGLKSTSAISASLVSVIAPILVIAGGGFFLKEKVTKSEKIGLTIALTGTLITLIQPLLEKQAQSSIKGNLLVLAGTVVWATFTLLSKKNKQLNTFILAGCSFLIGFFVFLPFFFFTRANMPLSSLFLIDSRALPGIIYMALLGSVVGYFAYLWGLKKIEASEATVFTYLQPIFAVPAAFVILGERPTLSFAIGALFIALGVYLSEKRQV